MVLAYFYFWDHKVIGFSHFQFSVLIFLPILVVDLLGDYCFAFRFGSGNVSLSVEPLFLGFVKDPFGLCLGLHDPIMITTF